MSGGEAIGLEGRFEDPAVRALIGVILSHPAARERRPQSATVDEHVYSMF
jgi:hypothetical protein